MGSWRKQQPTCIQCPGILHLLQMYPSGGTLLRGWRLALASLCGQSWGVCVREDVAPGTAVGGSGRDACMFCSRSMGGGRGMRVRDHLVVLPLCLADVAHVGVVGLAPEGYGRASGK